MLSYMDVELPYLPTVACLLQVRPTMVGFVDADRFAFRLVADGKDHLCTAM